MPFTIPNEASATYAAQAGLYSSDIDVLTIALAGGGVLSGCAVTTNTFMTLAVASGRVRLSNTFSSIGKTVAGGTATIGAADATNPRFDQVVIDATGAIATRAGTAAAAPVNGALAAGDIVLAQIYVPATTTSLSAGMIIDKRALLGSAPGTYLATDYGAIPDSFYTDGVANTAAVPTTGATLAGTQGTTAGTQFTSATANFTAADLGKYIFMARAGASSLQDRITTIVAVVSSTEIALAQAVGQTRVVRFLLSRGGDSTAAINAGMADIRNAGGGTLLLNGVGFLTTGITMENRCTIVGYGKRATLLHLAASSNRAVITNNQTLNDSAMFCSVRDMWVDGNRSNQQDITTTLNAAYTAGGTSLSITDITGLSNSGSILVGTSRFYYESKTIVSGNTGTLNTLQLGIEGTTDASYASGAAVTQHRAHGIEFRTLPYNVVGTIAEAYDPHFEVSDVIVKNCKADGVSLYGQSETRLRNVLAMYTDQFGFRPSFDTWMSDCTVHTAGRAGFFMKHSSNTGTNCKAFYCGGFVAADGHGFWFEGPTSIEEGCKVFSSSAAQDNKGHGVYARNAQRVMFQGTVSTNATGATAGTYVGLCIDGSSNGIFDVAGTDRAAGLQLNTLQILSTTATAQNNQITITHGATGAAATGTAIKGTVPNGNAVTVNSMGATQTSAPAAAGTVTPDPYLGTFWDIQLPAGNITVNAPANAHTGCTLRLTIIKDASVTARTVTWNAAYRFAGGAAPTITTTTSARDSVEFKYSGTAWYEIDRALNVAA